MYFDDLYFYFFWLMIFIFLFFYVFRVGTKASFNVLEQSRDNSISAGSWEPEELVSLRVDDQEYSLVNSVTNNWTNEGEVEFLENNYFKIGGKENLLEQNVLSQEIVSPKNSFYSLAFEYLLETTETDLGFDEPMFEVYAGDELIYQEWAVDASNNWQQALINISSLNKNKINLKFKAGNTVDSQYPSTVYIKNIKTNAASVNSQASFVLKSSGNQIKYEYFVDTQKISGVNFDSLEFWLDQQPDDYLVNIYLNNNLDSKLIVYFDDQKPELINDLVITVEGDNEFSLKFTSPLDNIFNRVNGYLVNQEHFVFSKRPAGNLETLLVSGFQPTSVKSVDQAGNIN
jgi:hypothetical protein